ncbi:hypothetical protein ASZ90_010140 [hydrocarbon metagenome]|uniref:NodB homology domain-containing protein n=1 Tax=hydrocarbon metagenome TaxID=938273 RepID=A0A0W8FIJ1_9ZZZZ
MDRSPRNLQGEQIECRTIFREKHKPLCFQCAGVSPQQMMHILRQDAEVWDLFTRKEEYGNRSRDQYGRFPYYRSRHRDISVPRASQMLTEKGYRCQFPEAQPFAICLTHDIDTVYEPLVSKGLKAVQALKNRDLSRAAGIIPELCSKKRSWWNFEEIASLEESYGAHSSFFFLALEDGAREYNYAVEDLEQEMCMLHDRGWEIGLHGGCEAYRDPAALAGEKRRLEKVLNRKVVGFRNHYLKFSVPETWELLEEAGFLYDTTLGYPDCIGFRNGMCHPFRPCNLLTNQEMRILEIPLVIMDQTLLSYMRLDPKQAWDQIEHLLNIVEQYHGVISILWHNNSMSGDLLRIYEKILKHCQERSAWMTSCREIASWWKKIGMRTPSVALTPAQ